jgi:hypothetical protein
LQEFVDFPERFLRGNKKQV